MKEEVIDFEFLLLLHFQRKREEKKKKQTQIFRLDTPLCNALRGILTSRSSEVKKTFFSSYTFLLAHPLKV